MKECHLCCRVVKQELIQGWTKVTWGGAAGVWEMIPAELIKVCHQTKRGEGLRFIIKLLPEPFFKKCFWVTDLRFLTIFFVVYHALGHRFPKLKKQKNTNKKSNILGRLWRPEESLVLNRSQVNSLRLEPQVMRMFLHTSNNSNHQLLLSVMQWLRQVQMEWPSSEPLPCNSKIFRNLLHCLIAALQNDGKRKCDILHFSLDWKARTSDLGVGALTIPPDTLTSLNGSHAGLWSHNVTGLQIGLRRCLELHR